MSEFPPSNGEEKKEGKPIGRPPGSTRSKILEQAMQVLELKVKGVSDELIKKTLGIRERDYERRLKAIRENKLLHRQAQGAIQEIVLRLFVLRNTMASKLDNLKEKDHHHRVKHAQVILDTEREILSVAKQLGYWPPPIEQTMTDDAIAAKTGDKKPDEDSGLPNLETLTDDELQRHCDSLISKA